jgi:PIN domain nuclease of toxin-antitoxin system
MILLDTHIWIWWVQDDPRLTARHQTHLRTHEPDGLGVSIYSCWEVAKLVEYNRLTIACSLEEWFRSALAYPGIQLLELTLPIAIESTRLTGFHKDPADQIIVATAKVLDIPILTADEKILNYPNVVTL